MESVYVAQLVGRLLEKAKLKPESWYPNYTPGTECLIDVLINLLMSLAMTKESIIVAAKANTAVPCSIDMQTLHSPTWKVSLMVFSHSCTILLIAFDILGGETGYLQRACMSSTIRLSSSLQLSSFWLEVSENILYRRVM